MDSKRSSQKLTERIYNFEQPNNEEAGKVDPSFIRINDNEEETPKINYIEFESNSIKNEINNEKSEIINSIKNPIKTEMIMKSNDDNDNNNNSIKELLQKIKGQAIDKSKCEFLKLEHNAPKSSSFINVNSLKTFLIDKENNNFYLSKTKINNKIHKLNNNSKKKFSLSKVSSISINDEEKIYINSKCTPLNINKNKFANVNPANQTVNKKTSKKGDILKLEFIKGKKDSLSKIDPNLTTFHKFKKKFDFIWNKLFSNKEEINSYDILKLINMMKNDFPINDMNYRHLTKLNNPEYSYIIKRKIWNYIVKGLKEEFKLKTQANYFGLRKGLTLSENDNKNFHSNQNNNISILIRCLQFNFKEFKIFRPYFKRKIFK